MELEMETEMKMIRQKKIDIEIKENGMIYR